MNDYSTPSPRMLFGRYKGRPLSEIPGDYLTWLLTTPNIRPGLRLDVQAELTDRQRRAWGTPQSTRAAGQLPEGVTIDEVLELIEAGRRSLARKHHPDAGGDLVIMQRLNAATDYLLETLPAVLCEAQR